MVKGKEVTAVRRHSQLEDKEPLSTNNVPLVAHMIQQCSNNAASYCCYSSSIRRLHHSPPQKPKITTSEHTRYACDVVVPALCMTVAMPTKGLTIPKAYTHARTHAQRRKHSHLSWRGKGR